MQMQAGSTTATMLSPTSERPASPALTNPDMILPYDDGEYDSNPSPLRNVFSASNEWRDPTDDNYSLSSPSHMGPGTPTTQIIYGNGTMLSDIGEVTEAETTPGRNKKLPGPAERRLLKQQAQSQHISIGSNPAPGHHSASGKTRKRNHQRSLSVESTSTVMSIGHSADYFEDFDDGVSVDDSNFQGDDEESVADSYRDPYREEVIEQETQRLSRKASKIGEEDEEEIEMSARRAEEILLNAKQRLTSMEGNLNRARTSLLTPVRSLSLINSSSPLFRTAPSPLDNGLPSPSRHRQLHTPIDSPVGTPGHSRVYSENSIVSPVGKGRFPVRSASAAARYIPNKHMDSHRRLGMSQSYESLREEAAFAASSLSRHSPPQPVILEPLNEDVANEEFDRGSATSSSQDEFVTPNGDHQLSRSTSSTQMRDLRGQMQDLKGRLSVLRDRARDDTMKRKSLQSLRTPSPFTAAEQWYTNASGYGEDPLSADAGLSPMSSGMSPVWKEEENTNVTRLSPRIDSTSPKNSPQPQDFEGSDVTSVYEDVSDIQQFSEVPKRSHEPQIRDRDIESGQDYTFLESEYQEESEYYNDEIVSVDGAGYESDSTAYHDSSDVPISHEDREDAFDYEHFFLHSAMGTIGQQGRKRSGTLGSFSSDDSGETTRAMQNSHQENGETFNPRASAHLRSESKGSISTMESFATAAESNSSDEDRSGNHSEDEDEYAVRHSNATITRLPTPPLTKRSTFGATQEGLQFPEDIPESPKLERSHAIALDEKVSNHNVVERNGTGGHRPSVSSVNSCSSAGTRRSFPLVNPPKMPEQPIVHGLGIGLGLRGSGESKSSVLTSDSTLIDRQSSMDEERVQTSPVHMLARDDQVLVERLVASLGKCVLGLQEAAPGSYDLRVWRRRLDAARRVLEGDEGAI
ncbi:hypothetical protein HYFRA_00010463 [Hymenoscyphus fraxineus]|uniref:Uncharacterized protein n=1 Tax=Hymenoscyphus fraxineus TaxID=746836 RepID=A0A9N9L5Y7_9HELO|nr:hypothetical protein HYFRA_00010463 [Hymenoscyphus fraxineus]